VKVQVNKQTTSLPDLETFSILKADNQSSDCRLSDSAKSASDSKARVYKVDEVAVMLAISQRSAYNLCNTTKDFKVIRIGGNIRINKESFDAWFATAGK
jgi:predicted DNA-binding transcriptional regulator AlpA